MRKGLILQNAFMIAISFIAGVACYQLFELKDAIRLIGMIDSRILADSLPTLASSIIPLAISIVVVLLFATHPYVSSLAKIFIAMKMTFFGFSSVYLLAQKSALLAYGAWWFPFQFIYAILLLLICESIIHNYRIHRKRGFLPFKQLLVLIVFIILIFVVELFVISYIFK